MPQAGKGRGGKGRGHAEKPAQSKKAYLQEKRERARQKGTHATHSDDDDFGGHGKVVDDEEPDCQPPAGSAPPVVVTSFGGSSHPSEARLSSFFVRDSDTAVAARRARGAKPLQVRARQMPVAQAIEFNAECPAASSFSRVLPHPMRPAWSQGVSGEQLEKKEAEYFAQWCEETSERIERMQKELNVADVAPFELNLQVWRQLWRVLEQSDVIFLIVDVRNPSYHIPPSIVREVTTAHSLRLVVVLNKVDLVSPAFVQRWRKYLATIMPEVTVVEFCSKPASEPPGGQRGAGTVGARRKWLARRCKQEEAEPHLRALTQVLMNAALGKDASPVTVDGVFREEPSRRKKGRAVVESDSDAESEKTDTETEGEDGSDSKDNDRPQEPANGGALPAGMTGRGPGGAMAIGLLGHPNAGKTSVLNALAGRKAASVSRTAGHTKHLQHIRIQENLHPCAYVLDCPGLVFPSLRSRAEAELNGSLPIAQVREAMSAVRVLGEATDLVKAYTLKLPDWYEKGDPWSPLNILEAYAEKHKYFMSRSGAPDIHRAGLELLRDAVDGALLLAYEPPSAKSTDEDS
eukprot:TRINITY_DN23021_c0_g1_i1.p1 TRINITY_DN23021_c0_g1~~TRINITY_DN23021_c0_g1_i1.p1  ORF type:complete len:575 (+),score=122.53 TRINITY_DN23021_c0_g1_i1:67-1791(+)